MNQTCWRVIWYRRFFVWKRPHLIFARQAWVCWVCDEGRDTCVNCWFGNNMKPRGWDCWRTADHDRHTALNHAIMVVSWCWSPDERDCDTHAQAFILGASQPWSRLCGSFTRYRNEMTLATRALLCVRRKKPARSLSLTICPPETRRPSQLSFCCSGEAVEWSTGEEQWWWDQLRRL